MFKPNVPLVVGYVARMILLESTVDWTEARLVQTREFDFGPRNSQ